MIKEHTAIYNEFGMKTRSAPRGLENPEGARLGAACGGCTVPGAPMEEARSGPYGRCDLSAGRSHDTAVEDVPCAAPVPETEVGN